MLPIRGGNWQLGTQIHTNKVSNDMALCACVQKELKIELMKTSTSEELVARKQLLRIAFWPHGELIKNLIFVLRRWINYCTELSNRPRLARHWGQLEARVRPPHLQECLVAADVHTVERSLFLQAHLFSGTLLL